MNNYSNLLLQPSKVTDLDDWILLLEGKKAIMETYHLNSEKAYQAWMENSKKKRGQWIKNILVE